MAALPYMPLYVADYLADAAHLSTLEHGAYLLLIMTYWQRGKALPDDDKKLARIARLQPEEWAGIRDEMAEFFDVDDGVWTHKRIDAELEKVRDKSEKAKRGGKARAQQERTERSANAKQTLSERSANAERTSSHTDTDTDTDTSTPPSEGASAPPDAKSVVFGDGLTLLTGAGRSERSARSHLGKLCKAHGDEAVATAVRETIRAGPVDPAPYLERLCRGESSAQIVDAMNGGMSWS